MSGSRLRFACQTYSWQMSIDRYRGRIDHMTELAAQAGFTGFEAELVMLGDEWSADGLSATLERVGLHAAALVLAEPWLDLVETPHEQQRADLLIDALGTLGHGAKLVLVPLPGPDRADLERRQRTAMACMAAVTRRAAEAGIQATFHPNSPAGSVFRTADDYRVMHELWPDGLGYTPDVGHIAKGGMDPLTVLEEQWDLIDHVHIKDLDSTGAWAPTGAGVVDVDGVLGLLRDRDFEGWVTFEEESEQAERDPDGATLANGAWLRDWGASVVSEHTGLASMLPIGINTFVWYSPLTQERTAGILDRIAGWGYEGVELALEQVGDWDVDLVAEQLRRLGLRSVVGGVFGPGRELVSADEETIVRTTAYVRAALEIAARQGSALVIGPLYTSVGRTWRMAPEERRSVVRKLRETLAPLVDTAAELGVPLALEPLNRYETSLFNTTEQLLELIDPLPEEGVGLNLDTYHMNIEEQSLDAAFRAAGRRLLHLQVCGNDRGVPGEDHLDWDGIRTSLERIGYRGMLGFESFTSDNETIATAASIWRPFAATQDDLAVRTLGRLRSWRTGWTASSA